jgi:hypothetical protein
MALKLHPEVVQTEQDPSTKKCQRAAEGTLRLCQFRDTWGFHETPGGCLKPWTDPGVRLPGFKSQMAHYVTVFDHQQDLQPLLSSH